MNEELKQQLVDELINQIKADIEMGDTTVIDDLLMRVDNNILIESLPEEHWQKYQKLL